jgi:hypothetical protein
LVFADRLSENTQAQFIRGWFYAGYFFRKCTFTENKLHPVIHNKRHSDKVSVFLPASA